LVAHPPRLGRARRRGRPVATASLDCALFAALSGRRAVELADDGPGVAAFAATWRPLLDTLGFRLARAAPPARGLSQRKRRGPEGPRRQQRLNLTA
jgi:hypothetical protein